MIVILRRGVTIVLVPVVMRVIVGNRHILPAERYHDRGERLYDALVSIGRSGLGTLDKVAGPVGEALIMTALGLAVAIPAVLAYNAFMRSNRLVLARLDAFAHDLYAALATGGRAHAKAEN